MTEAFAELERGVHAAQRVFANRAVRKEGS